LPPQKRGRADNNKNNIKKTAVLYFDMLNGYFHGMDKAAKARKKPMVDKWTRAD
jgi:hypothetical protein